eukprot:13533602-Alexandrium_andersonii.AAC.1
MSRAFEATGENSPGGDLRLLNARDVRSGAIFSTVAQQKGPGDLCLATLFARWLGMLGYKRIV